MPRHLRPIEEKPKREEPIPDTETEQGESLDEALASESTERPSSRKGKAKRSFLSSPGTLELGEMGRIVERVFHFDFDRTYTNVIEFLKPRDDRKLDLGMLERELDEATDKAREAHRLYTNAREALAIFEIDKDLIVSSMRDNARHKLEEDKRNRIRIKPITDADVLGMMKMQDPARWRDLRIKTVRMEATVDHLKYITDLARDRISALKTLVGKK